MRNKQSVVLLILLLALFTLACQSPGSFDFGIAEFLQGEDQNEDTQTWPKLRVGSIRQIENIVDFGIPIENVSNALQHDSPALRPLSLEPVFTISKVQPQPVAAQLFANELLPPLSNENYEELILHNLFLGTLTDHVPQLTADKPYQINSFHSSKKQLETIKITVNEQPLFADEGSTNAHIFPEKFLDVYLCTNEQWQKNPGAGPSLHCKILGRKNTFPPRETTPTRELRFSLVVKGKIPGTYNISLSTTDGDGKEKQITQQIEVVKPSP